MLKIIKARKNEYFRLRFCVLLNSWKERQKAKKESYSDTTFANEIGVKRSAVVKYKTGVAQPSDKTLARICETFNIPYDYFDPVVALELIKRDLDDMSTRIALMLTENQAETTQTILRAREVLNGGVNTTDE